MLRLVLLALISLIMMEPRDDTGGRPEFGTTPGGSLERRLFERLWKQYHLAAHAAHKAGAAEVGPFRPGNRFDLRTPQARPLVPEPVQTAFDFYFLNVERRDWGSVHVDRTEPGSLLRSFWIVRVSTDGDDGWIELFDEAGQPLGAGRLYLELVSWSKPDEIRNMVHSGAFPAALADRHQRTLWAKD